MSRCAFCFHRVETAQRSVVTPRAVLSLRSSVRPSAACDRVPRATEYRVPPSAPFRRLLGDTGASNGGVESSGANFGRHTQSLKEHRQLIGVFGSKAHTQTNRARLSPTDPCDFTQKRDWLRTLKSHSNGLAQAQRSVEFERRPPYSEIDGAAARRDRPRRCGHAYG